MNSGYIYVIMCYILVGISYPIAADAMYAIPVWTFISITFAIGFISLYAVDLISKGQNLFSLSLKAWGIISVQFYLVLFYTLHSCYTALNTPMRLLPLSSRVFPPLLSWLYLSLY